MLGTLKWPEFKRLWGTSINNNLKLELTFGNYLLDAVSVGPDNRQACPQSRSSVSEGPWE